MQNTKKEFVRFYASSNVTRYIYGERENESFNLLNRPVTVEHIPWPNLISRIITSRFATTLKVSSRVFGTQVSSNKTGSACLSEFLSKWS